jgi:hypothetical protein
MEMLLMGLCWTVFGLGVAAIAFGAATRSESPESTVQPQPSKVKAVVPTRFFSDGVATPPLTTSTRVPVEVLLRQIESHVRLEQAAAESFIAFPTEAQLHSKTSSPLVN